MEEWTGNRNIWWERPKICFVGGHLVGTLSELNPSLIHLGHSGHCPGEEFMDQDFIICRLTFLASYMVDPFHASPLTSFSSRFPLHFSFREASHQDGEAAVESLPSQGPGG